MLSWVHDEVAVHSPILIVTSAEPESGKTTTLGLMAFLMPRCLATVEISDAALYRSIKRWQPSFAIDEFDSVLSGDDRKGLRTVINSGHTRAQCVVRCEGDDKIPEPFATFAPKTLGMIGRDLPPATARNPRLIGIWTFGQSIQGGDTPREKSQMRADKRRYGVIEVRRINAETYWLEINGVMWAEVEWSPKRRAWCVQDAAGHCLAHVEHIVGQNINAQTAIKLAKRMIVSGEMPSPEAAHAQLRAEQGRARPKTRAKNRKLERKQEHEPLGQLIVGDITARSEAVPAGRKAGK